MLQKIWREYKNAFRLSNFKKLTENNTWWFYIYLLTFFPAVCNMFDSPREITCYYFIVLPFLFVRLGGDLYPLALPKMMFLCPMDAGERIRYLKLCYRLKIFVTTVFAGVCLLILFLLGYLSPAGSLYILFVFFCTALGCNLQTEALPVQSGQDKKTSGIFLEFSVWNTLHLILGLLITISCALFLFEVEISVPVVAALAFAGLFLQLLLTGRILKFYRPILAVAADYERAIGLKERTSDKP